MSSNKILCDRAVKYRSLVSMKSEQVEYVQWLVARHMEYTHVAPLPSIKRNE